MNNTTRRMPRTMHEAFPTGTAYAAAIERTRSRGCWFCNVVALSMTLLSASVVAAALVLIVVDVVTGWLK